MFGSIGAETVPGFGTVGGADGDLKRAGNGTANVPGVENAADGVREGTDNVRDNSGDGSGMDAPDEAVKDAKDGSGAASEGISDDGGLAAAADGSNAAAPDTAETSGQETPAEGEQNASSLTVDDLIRVAAQKIKLKKLGTMIKVSNELLNDSAFDIASYIAERFGVSMGNAEEKAFISGDGDKKPTGLLAETGAQIGVTASSETAVSFDDIFRLYYSLKAPYRRRASFLCNEGLVLQLMMLKDKNDNYLWKPSLDTAKPDTILSRPIYTSAFMPAPSKGQKALVFGDYGYYWVADRGNRTFRRLNELYARTDQVGFLTTQRVDGKLILPEAVKYLKMSGTAPAGSDGEPANG